MSRPYGYYQPTYGPLPAHPGHSTSPYQPYPPPASQPYPIHKYAAPAPHYQSRQPLRAVPPHNPSQQPSTHILPAASRAYAAAIINPASHRDGASSPFSFASQPLRQYPASQAPRDQQTSTPNGDFGNQSSSQNPSGQTNSYDQPKPPLSDNNPGKIDLGLGRIRKLMANLPPIRTPAIHLAGTNGKGSVSVLLESCLLAAGLSVARYNSPHLIEARRAISLNGRPPSIETFLAAVHQVNAINNQLGINATLFELATATAYTVISGTNSDVMIIECGMGGETDATNVLLPQYTIASGLTAVGLDHTEFLGVTIAKIAEVKARITVRGGMLAVAPQRSNEVMPVVQHVVAERRARLVSPVKVEKVEAGRKVRINVDNFKVPPSTRIRADLRNGMLEAELSLAGDHQLDNCSLALAILDTIRSDLRALQIQSKLGKITNDALKSGLRSAEWFGRCSWIQHIALKDRPMLLDGAHNADSAATLRRYIDSLDVVSISTTSVEASTEGSPKITWIISLSESKAKTPSSILSPLLRKGDDVILTRFSTPIDGMPWIKPVDPSGFVIVAQSLVDNHGEAGNVSIAEDGLEAALEMSKGSKGLIVICGSLYLVSDLYRMIEYDSAQRS